MLDDLLKFIAEATTPFHAVSAMTSRLQTAGFQHWDGLSSGDFQPGEGYFVTRNDSAVIAFRVGNQPLSEGARLVGAHTDSPNLSVKPNPLKLRHGVAQLAVDVYGGALLNPWFDRDLSLAGRVSFLTSDGQLQSELIDFKRPIAVIPSLAIHLDREANSQRSINPQRDILPLLMGVDDDTTLDFNGLLSAELCTQYPAYENIKVLDFELSFYDTQAPALTGFNRDFIAAARLDNLLSCHVGLSALIEATSTQWSFLICTDHEEVGSASVAGAQGPMLTDVLTALSLDDNAERAARSRSWMMSVDNAHAVHPNFSDKHDDNHGPLLNRGPVIKINRNQRYATSGEGAALTRVLADRAGVPIQSFVVRTDLGCGSTIGPITAAETGIPTIDLGVPTLAMHSIRELAGAKDPEFLKQLLVAFYNRVA
ncbi:M18 family aminopeptidase [Flavobacteriaceae bacterium]|nr:M18 family aminopeptidase [Flavobacteriaceae bacterium]